MNLWILRAVIELAMERMIFPFIEEVENVLVISFFFGFSRYFHHILKTHLLVPLPLGGGERHPADEELPHAVPLVLVTRGCN